MTKHQKAALAFIAYALSIPLANYMIGHVGTPAFPGGPHVIDVGFGQTAPSGVLLIGVALAARDAIQAAIGARWALLAIAIGVALSFGVNPDVATASAVAFGAGELADLAVFTPLRRRHLSLAVIVSGVVGGVIDTFIFLQIAFGSTQFWQGQVIGKTMVALACGASVWTWRAVSHRLDPQVA